MLCYNHFYGSSMLMAIPAEAGLRFPDLFVFPLLQSNKVIPAGKEELNGLQLKMLSLIGNIVIKHRGHWLTKIADKARLGIIIHLRVRLKFINPLVPTRMIGDSWKIS